MSIKKPKIYVHGADNVGWAIHAERNYTLSALSKLNYRVVNNPLFADLIISVYWNLLSKTGFQLLKFKPVVTLATNFIDLDNPDYLNRKAFDKVNKRVKAWVAPSTRQMEIFQRHGVKSFYRPFYVESTFHQAPNLSKRDICRKLGLPYEKLAGKTVFGSFQRDTLGSDLTQPKWQKGPQLLINTLKSLKNKNDFLLLLASPRRHYVIDQCNQFDIPFLYVGALPEAGVDDIEVNTVDNEQIKLLYHLIDSYLVTSTSEGGPKAVMEAALANKIIFSTDVGLVGDFIHPECIFSSENDFSNGIEAYLNNPKDSKWSEAKIFAYKNAKQKLSQESMERYLINIIDGMTT